MDLDEWELLPDTGSFLDFRHEGGGKQLLRRELSFDDKLVLKMNYFVCPPKSTTPSRHLGSDDRSGDYNKNFKDITVVVPPQRVLDSPDVVSQVLFEKMTSRISCCRGFAVPLPEPEPIQLGAGEEERVYDLGKEVGMGLEVADDAEAKSCERSDMKSEYEQERNSGSVCRWKMTGAGVLCSIGAATATICCIFVLGGTQARSNSIGSADEKRIERAVHHAMRLNHALSAAKGAPMTRAHISFGG